MTESISANIITANIDWTTATVTTIKTGWRGTGRTFVAQTMGKRRGGKPIAAGRLRVDLIVACVRELERDGGKLDACIVPAVADHFGVSIKTVWNALKEDRKPGPISLGWIGPLQRGKTYSTIT